MISFLVELPNVGAGDLGAERKGLFACYPKPLKPLSA